MFIFLAELFKVGEFKLMNINVISSINSNSRGKSSNQPGFKSAYVKDFNGVWRNLTKGAKEVSAEEIKNVCKQENPIALYASGLTSRLDDFGLSIKAQVNKLKVILTGNEAERYARGTAEDGNKLNDRLYLNSCFNGEFRFPGEAKIESEPNFASWLS